MVAKTLNKNVWEKLNPSVCHQKCAITSVLLSSPSTISGLAGCNKLPREPSKFLRTHLLSMKTYLWVFSLLQASESPVPLARVPPCIRVLAARSHSPSHSVLPQLSPHPYVPEEQASSCFPGSPQAQQDPEGSSHKDTHIF